MGPKVFTTCRLLAAAGVAAASLHLPAQAYVLIDDFGSGGFDQTLAITGHTPWVGYQSGTMIGGWREVVVETFEAPAAGDTRVGVGSDGTLAVSSAADVAHLVAETYGKTPAGNAPLGLDLSAEDRIRVRFSDNQSPFDQLNFVITLHDRALSYLQIGINVPDSALPVDVDFRFADGAIALQPGAAAFDFAHVDYITLQAQGAQSWGIDSIAAVPEPGVWLLLLAGLGAVGWVSSRRGPARASV